MSLRSDDLELDSQHGPRVEVEGLTMMITKRYQFRLFNRKADGQSTDLGDEVGTCLGM
jgi:hypothetical protein